MVAVKFGDATRQLSQWVRLRHCIAHGYASVPVLAVLEAVRQEAAAWQSQNPGKSFEDALKKLKRANFQPTVRFNDARNCMALFRRLAQLTANGLENLGAQPPGCW